MLCLFTGSRNARSEICQLSAFQFCAMHFEFVCCTKALTFYLFFFFSPCRILFFFILFMLLS